MKKFLSILTVLLFVFAVGGNFVDAAVSVTAATGGNAISADTCNSTWTTLTGPVIVEGAAGEVGAGTIVITAPAGFEFNTGENVIAFVTGQGTKLVLSASGATPTASTITFTVSSVSVGSPSTIFFSNIKVRPTTCTVPSTGNLVFSGGAGVAGNTGALTLVPGTAVSFTVTGMADPIVAGVEDASVTITAKDANNNIATGYTGTVHFTSNDAQAVLPADHAFEAGDNGVHIFPFTLKTVGERTITATDTVTSSITGSQSAITVTVAAKAKLTITAEPTIGYTHVDFSTQPLVEIQDAFGNKTADTDSVTIAAYSDATCDTAIATNFTGTKSLAAVAGLATFSGISYDTVRTAGLYLGTTAAGLTKDCSALFKIYGNTGQTVTTSGTTATTTPTTTAPAQTTTTTTTAPETTTTTTSTNVIPQPAKPIAEMNQAEKNTYTMQLQQFLIQLLTQLLTLLKK